MRIFSMIDNKTFTSVVLGDIVQFISPYGVQIDTIPEMLHEVCMALCENMEITYDQMRHEWSNISAQGTLASPDDYLAGNSGISPAEHRALASLRLFFIELMKHEATKESPVSQTFVQVNLNTGNRVTWSHAVL